MKESLFSPVVTVTHCSAHKMTAFTYIVYIKNKNTEKSVDYRNRSQDAAGDFQSRKALDN